MNPTDAPKGADFDNVALKLAAALEGTEHQEYFEMHLHRYRFLARRIEAARPRGRVLDVGASPGHMTAICAGLGCDVTAADLYPHRQFPAKSSKTPFNLFHEMSLPVVAVDISRGALPFGDGAFDLVLFNETLEHLIGSPLPAVKEMARVLAPGGRIIVTTPNVASLRNRLSFLAGRNIYTPLKVAIALEPYKCHNREYTLAEVVELVGLAGLKPVSATMHNIGEPIAGTVKNIARAAYYAATTIFPPGRSLICVIAEK